MHTNPNANNDNTLTPYRQARVFIAVQTRSFQGIKDVGQAIALGHVEMEPASGFEPPTC
tara:strand:+ start:1631 stop:1807 length:177 start_codon:yes stop_codon:yes gene_type:complete